MLQHENVTSVIPSQLGLASIVGRVYGGADPVALMQEITARLDDPAQAAGAWLDLSILRRSLGDVENAEIFQNEALNASRIFRQLSTGEKPLRLLAFKTAGNFMVNTPVEFMLEGSNVELVSVYLSEDTKDIGSVPEHDVALLAIGESPESREILNKCKILLHNWPRRILNFNVETILSFDRSLLWRALADVDGLSCPWTSEFARDTLLHDPREALSARLNGADLTFPLIVRPEGAHAGINTSKVESLDELSAVLNNLPAENVHVSRFIDYSSDDGQFRKYRIALIDGVAYPAHMAISSKWMVHYLNAGMTESAAKRDEEAKWFNSFHHNFAMKHEVGFQSLCDTLNLDYFAIDCAEAKDGTLLIFEIDTAMIVHCMDVEPEFSYKKAPMQKLFAAFQAMLTKKQEATYLPTRVNSAMATKES